MSEPPRKRRGSKTTLFPPVQAEAEAIQREAHGGNLPVIWLPPPIPPQPQDQNRYLPDYCRSVVEFMSLGFTLSAFAAEIGICRETLRVWRQKHPEFDTACRVGKLAAQRWWEDQLHEVAQKGTHTSGRTAAILFALKNLAKDDFADVQRVEVGRSRDDAPVADLSRLSREELLTLERLAAKALPPADPEGTG